MTFKSNALGLTADWRLALVFWILSTLVALPSNAQNLDEGKDGAELFASNCSSCHQSPKDLALQKNDRSLSEFLRQHYTSDSTTVAVMSGYLLGDPSRWRSEGNQADRAPAKRSRQVKVDPPPL